MIKLKDLIKEVGPKSSKDEETIPIKHKTSGKELVIVDTPKNRKKYTKMGYIIPLPKHLQKLIKDLEKRDKEFSKYGVEVTDVIVPGLEWMNDIPEGVVKKGTQIKETYERMFGTLNEAKEEKVYMLKGMLWLSYSPNSGQTTRIRGRGWITNDSSEKNFDSGVKGFAKWSKTQKPIKKKTASNGSKVSLFRIPEYTGGDAKEYTIWGGDEKPKWRYLLVSLGKKIDVISVFHSKGEAMSWIGHTA